MLDLRSIREKSEFFKSRLALREGDHPGQIDNVLELDEKIRKLKRESESLKSDRNKQSKEIGTLKLKGLDIAKFSASVKAMGEEIAQLDKEQETLDRELTSLLLRLPNLTHESVPTGKSATDNRIDRIVGSPVIFDFKPLPHWEIATKLCLLDFEAAAKISGSGFLVYTGKGARLERALINYLLDLHTTEHGYIEVSPPFLVRGEAMVGTSQLPKFADDMYRVEEQPPLYLVPTAEVPITNLHREEILNADRLPIQYAAYTPCFRREAGSAGKDTRGMIRVHQFDKVELVHIVKPETSYSTLEVLLGHAERVLKDLGLHYRVLSLCTGDIGFGAAKCYDLEVWAPGVGAFLEVSSCSNFEDFQARRLNLRYKNAEGDNIFCHTLNGSGLALPRLYLALLETYQRADGHVQIPEPLRPYMGGLEYL